MTVSAKELVAQFRAAEWAGPRDVESFVRDLPPAAPEAVLKVLEALAQKGADKDERHRLRCQAFDKLVRKQADRSLFVPMVHALKTADPTLRGVLIAVVPFANDVAEHRELCVLLKSPEVGVRGAASQLLGELGGKGAVQILTDFVREPSFPGRKEAIDALARCAGSHAIPALRAVALKGAPAERLHALKYLGDVRCVGKAPGQALEAIAEVLEHDPSVRGPAIAAFCHLCSEDDYFVAIAPYLDSDDVESVRAAVEGLARFRSPRVLSALERKLRAGPNGIRLSVIATLEAIASDEVLPVLVDAIGHEQLLVRNRASEALASLGRQGKLDLARTVIWLMNSRDVNVRRSAVELARNTPDQGDQLWPKLLKLLRDTDWWVRERVADVLVEVAGKKLTAHIVPYLTDSSDVVRRFAVDLLVRLGDPLSLGPLLKVATGDPDWWARERAIEAVATLKDDRAVPYLVKLLEDEEVRLPAIDALGKLGAKAAAPQIAALSQCEDADVRLAAAKCLAGFDDHKLLAPIQNALADEDTRVRAVAREAIARWKEPAREGSHKGPAIDRLLAQIAAAEGDDLILAVGHPPTMKKLGRTEPLSSTVLTAEQTKALLAPVLKAEHLQQLESRGDTDLSYDCVAEGLRFRVNAFKAEGGVSAAFRIIRGRLLDFDALGLPKVVRKLTELKNGLVIIGGPTGSGKSTTLAALVDHVIHTRSQHLIALEDPIEVVHQSDKCLVNQREIGAHAVTFSSALRAALREDPDVLLVGEMRDLATISAAVSAAETGHLVFATLHTVSADASVDRLINVFPAAQQDQVRAMIAESLRAVICQYLFVRRDTPGRSLALEVMLNNEAVSNLIRKAKTFQIPSVIASSAELGMQTMDSDLMRLAKSGQISFEDAYVKARSKKEFEEQLAAERQNVAFHLPPVSSLLSGRPAPAEPAPSGPPRPAPGHMAAAQPKAPPAQPKAPPPPPAAPYAAPQPTAPRPAPGHMAAAQPGALPQIVRARPSAGNHLAAPPPRLASSPPAAPPVLAKAPMPIGDEHTQPEMQMVEISAHLVVDLPGSGDEEAKQAWSRFVEAQDKAAAAPPTLKALEAVIARHPACATAHYFCGQVYLFNGDEPNARAWFERTLAVDAQHGPAQQRLAAMRS